MLIEREMYMRRIRPFIGKDVVRVMTGLRSVVNPSCLNL